VARDPDVIQREIETARDALAVTLDELGTKADPRRFVDSGKTTLRRKLNDPRVRYALIGAGALVTIVVVRRILR
jgi:hypothetical protein